MAKKRHYSSHLGEGSYEGPLNKARKEERKDFMMLSEDHSAPANLPQDVKYHAWPKVGHYANFESDDTIRGIDDQMNADGAQMARRKAGNKW
jgi:hypothetical protein